MTEDSGEGRGVPDNGRDTPPQQGGQERGAPLTATAEGIAARLAGLPTDEGSRRTEDELSPAERFSAHIQSEIDRQVEEELRPKSARERAREAVKRQATKDQERTTATSAITGPYLDMARALTNQPLGNDVSQIGPAFEEAFRHATIDQIRARAAPVTPPRADEADLPKAQRERLQEQRARAQELRDRQLAMIDTAVGFGIGARQEEHEPIVPAEPEKPLAPLTPDEVGDVPDEARDAAREVVYSELGIEQDGPQAELQKRLFDALARDGGGYFPEALDQLAESMPGPVDEAKAKIIAQLNVARIPAHIRPNEELAADSRVNEYRDRRVYGALLQAYCEATPGLQDIVADTAIASDPTLPTDTITAADMRIARRIRPSDPFASSVLRRISRDAYYNYREEPAAPEPATVPNPRPGTEASQRGDPDEVIRSRFIPAPTAAELAQGLADLPPLEEPSDEIRKSTVTHSPPGTQTDQVDAVVRSGFDPNKADGDDPSNGPPPDENIGATETESAAAQRLSRFIQLDIQRRVDKELHRLDGRRKPSRDVEQSLQERTYLNIAREILPAEQIASLDQIGAAFDRALRTTEPQALIDQIRSQPAVGSMDRDRQERAVQLVVLAEGLRSEQQDVAPRLPVPEVTKAIDSYAKESFSARESYHLSNLQKGNLVEGPVLLAELQDKNPSAYIAYAALERSRRKVTRSEYDPALDQALAYTALRDRLAGPLNQRGAAETLDRVLQGQEDPARALGTLQLDAVETALFYQATGGDGATTLDQATASKIVAISEVVVPFARGDIPDSPEQRHAVENTLLRYLTGDQHAIDTLTSSTFPDDQVRSIHAVIPEEPTFAALNAEIVTREQEAEAEATRIVRDKTTTDAEEEIAEVVQAHRIESVTDEQIAQLQADLKLARSIIDLKVKLNPEEFNELFVILREGTDARERINHLVRNTFTSISGLVPNDSSTLNVDQLEAIVGLDRWKEDDNIVDKWPKNPTGGIRPPANSAVNGLNNLWFGRQDGVTLLRNYITTHRDRGLTPDEDLALLDQIEPILIAASQRTATGNQDRPPVDGGAPPPDGGNPPKGESTDSTERNVDREMVDRILHNPNILHQITTFDSGYRMSDADRATSEDEAPDARYDSQALTNGDSHLAQRILGGYRWVPGPVIHEQNIAPSLNKGKTKAVVVELEHQNNDSLSRHFALVTINSRPGIPMARDTFGYFLTVPRSDTETCAAIEANPALMLEVLREGYGLDNSDSRTIDTINAQRQAKGLPASHLNKQYLLDPKIAVDNVTDDNPAGGIISVPFEALTEIGKEEMRGRQSRPLLNTAAGGTESRVTAGGRELEPLPTLSPDAQAYVDRIRDEARAEFDEAIAAAGPQPDGTPEPESVRTARERINAIMEAREEVQFSQDYTQTRALLEARTAQLTTALQVEQRDPNLQDPEEIARLTAEVATAQGAIAEIDQMGQDTSSEQETPRESSAFPSDVAAYLRGKVAEARATATETQRLADADPTNQNARDAAEKARATMRRLQAAADPSAIPQARTGLVRLRLQGDISQVSGDIIVANATSNADKATQLQPELDRLTSILTSLDRTTLTRAANAFETETFRTEAADIQAALQGNSILLERFEGYIDNQDNRGNDALERLIADVIDDELRARLDVLPRHPVPENTKKETERTPQNLDERQAEHDRAFQDFMTGVIAPQTYTAYVALGQAQDNNRDQVIQVFTDALVTEEPEHVRTFLALDLEGTGLRAERRAKDKGRPLLTGQTPIRGTDANEAKLNYDLQGIVTDMPDACLPLYARMTSASQADFPARREELLAALQQQSPTVHTRYETYLADRFADNQVRPPVRQPRPRPNPAPRNGPPPRPARPSPQPRPTPASPGGPTPPDNSANPAENGRQPEQSSIPLAAAYIDNIISEEQKTIQFIQDLLTDPGAPERVRQRQETVAYWQAVKAEAEAGNFTRLDQQLEATINNYRHWQEQLDIRRLTAESVDISWFNATFPDSRGDDDNLRQEFLDRARSQVEAVQQEIATRKQTLQQEAADQERERQRTEVRTRADGVIFPRLVRAEGAVLRTPGDEAATNEDVVEAYEEQEKWNKINTAAEAGNLQPLAEELPNIVAKQEAQIQQIMEALPEGETTSDEIDILRADNQALTQLSNDINTLFPEFQQTAPVVGRRRKLREFIPAGVRNIVPRFLRRKGRTQPTPEPGTQPPNTPEQQSAPEAEVPDQARQLIRTQLEQARAALGNEDDAQAILEELIDGREPENEAEATCIDWHELQESIDAGDTQQLSDTLQEIITEREIQIARHRRRGAPTDEIVSLEATLTELTTLKRELADTGIEPDNNNPQLTDIRVRGFLQERLDNESDPARQTRLQDAIDTEDNDELQEVLDEEAEKVIKAWLDEKEKGDDADTAKLSELYTETLRVGRLKLQLQNVLNPTPEPEPEPQQGGAIKRWLRKGFSEDESQKHKGPILNIIRDNARIMWMGNENKAGLNALLNLQISGVYSAVLGTKTRRRVTYSLVATAVVALVARRIGILDLGADPTDITPGPTTTPEVPAAGQTTSPDAAPTVAPTTSPDAAPTAAPTTSPDAAPTAAPTTSPDAAPTVAPTTSPDAAPTVAPTTSPDAPAPRTTTPNSPPPVTPRVVPPASPIPTPGPDVLPSQPGVGPDTAPQLPADIPPQFQAEFSGFEHEAVKGDTRWEIISDFVDQNEKTIPGGNWENQSNGVTKGDVLADMWSTFQERHGLDADNLQIGETVDFSDWNSFTDEEKNTFLHALQTNSADQYIHDVMPEFQHVVDTPLPADAAQIDASGSTESLPSEHVLTPKERHISFDLPGGGEYSFDIPQGTTVGDLKNNLQGIIDQHSSALEAKGIPHNIADYIVSSTLEQGLQAQGIDIDIPKPNIDSAVLLQELNSIPQFEAIMNQPFHHDGGALWTTVENIVAPADSFRGWGQEKGYTSFTQILTDMIIDNSEANGFDIHNVPEGEYTLEQLGVKPSQLSEFIVRLFAQNSASGYARNVMGDYIAAKKTW